MYLLSSLVRVVVARPPVRPCCSGFLLILSHLLITDPGVRYSLGSQDLLMMAPTAFLSSAAEGASGSWSKGWPVLSSGRTGHCQATVGLGRMAISPSCSFRPGQPGCLASLFSSSVSFFSGNIIITYLSHTPVLLDDDFEIWQIILRQKPPIPSSCSLAVRIGRGFLSSSVAWKKWSISSAQT